ncbi:MAG: thioesterase family protein [Caulobacteraceae bacterium]
MRRRGVPHRQDALVEDPATPLEVWRGGVNTWECDEMGHMNVRFYVARAMEGLVGLAAGFGLPGAFRANASATLLVREQHIRFMREALARAPLHMTAGVLDLGENEARILQLLYHSNTGEIAASFVTVVAHVTARDERPFPWSQRTRALARTLAAVVPPGAGPRGLGTAPATSRADGTLADELGLMRLGAGAIGPEECDIFGRMRPEVFIGRVADNVPRLAGVFRDPAAAVAPDRPASMGGAVVEYRLLHTAWPRAGDRFEIRSGMAAVDARTQRLVHWMIDPASGRAWGSAEALAVSFDLATRKVVEIGDADRTRLARFIVPGLSL